MLDLIYIVEEQFEPSTAPSDDTNYYPNFTMGGHDGAHSVKPNFEGAAATGAAAAGMAMAISPFSLPIALITSAMLGTPSLISLISKDRMAKAEGPDPAMLEESRLLSSYVQRHSMARSQAKVAGYRFQPGHPVIGKAYRKHPLTDYPNPDSGNLYIPSDSYDAILLEERESELIKLLVHLGATKITITKKASENNINTVTASVSIQAGPVGGGDVNCTGSSERDTDTHDTREFSLLGRPWKTDSKVEREKFFWLDYEPSWKAVVFAREHGGCITASIELKESTSFSTDKNLELSVKAKLAEVGAQAGMSSVGKEEKTYFVRVEFAPVHQSA